MKPLNKLITSAFRCLSHFVLVVFLFGFQLNTASAEELVTYYHNDLLGSPVAVTDEYGNLLWNEEYMPYGERILNDGKATNNHIWYTGKEQDATTGLSYMGARYYHPDIGRFMAIDPVGFVESNPTSFNRYAYANNNPYRYTDPDGQIPVDTVWDAISIVYDVGKIGYGYATDNPRIVSEGFVDLTADAIALVTPYLPAGQTKVARIAKKRAGKFAKGSKGTADGARAGRNHTRGAIKEAKRRNAERNGGDVLCETCGVKTTPTTRRTKGSTVDPREGQGDHIFPKSRGGNGATVKDQSNIDIKCASCNNRKSNNL